MPTPAAALDFLKNLPALLFDSRMVFWHLLQLVLGLGFAILVHEFGHLLAARWAGIRVHRFSIGFGRRLAGFTWRGIEFVFAPVLIGGYVKLAGEEWDEDHAPRSYELMAKPWWKRIVVYAAGVTMNLALAWVLFFGVLLVGLDLTTYPAVVGEVTAGGPAAKAGLKVGDRITAVGGTPVVNWMELDEEAGKTGKGGLVDLTVVRAGGTRTVRLAVDADPGMGPLVEPLVGTVVPMYPASRAGIRTGDRVLAIDGKPVTRWVDLPVRIAAGKGKPSVFRIRRDGAILTLTITPKWDAAHGRALIGIEPKAPLAVTKRFGPFTCAKYAALEIGTVAAEIPKSLWLVVSGKAAFKDVMGGPILIARLGIAKAEQGLADLIHFIGLLNVQLLVVNLLPIPVLDGGMILLAVLEALRRRRFAYATYARLTNVGASLLIGLMLYTFFVDLRR